MNWNICSRILGFCVLALLLPFEALGQQPDPQGGQRMLLSPGWNLIAVQVEPEDADPAASFGVDGVVSVWAYDGASQDWRVWLNAVGEQIPLEIPGRALERIRLGGAYWVQTSRAGVAVTISGVKPGFTDGTELSAGWNLLGVPVVGPGAEGELERISMISVLARAGAKYDRILKWENDLLPGADARRARSYNQIDPSQDTEDFRYFDPERGYWIRVTEAGALQPELLLTLRSDVDRAPKGNFPSKEDLNITYHGVDELPEEPVVTPIGQQRRIVFLKGEEVMTLGISNVGGGILLWELRAEDDWLEIATEAKGEAHEVLQGVTTVESDTIFLRLNAGKLGQESGQTTLRLRTSLSAAPIEFQVSAEAPTIEGEWKGFAIIETVNGRRNGVPDIDLFLSVFEDPTVAGMFRGVIDSSNTLMWPVDVSLVGYLTDANEGRFHLGGGFILPPGDVNNEPFEEFPGENDADWNRNGEFEDLNPLPFPIQRSVSLDGAVVAGDPVNGFRIEGNYTEVVHGMLPEAIELRGRFSLARNSLVPFGAYQSEEAIVEAYSPEFRGRDPFVTQFPAGQTALSNSIGVTRDFILHQLQVTLQFAGPLTHSDFTVHLVAPAENGAAARRLLLYASDPEAPLNPARLQNVIFPDSRPFEGDLVSFMAGLANARGDWQIEIANSGATSVALTEWSLRLVGQPVGDISVHVSGEDGESLTDVTVDLAGLPYANSVEVPANGSVNLRRVPPVPISVNAFRLTSEGYQSVQGRLSLPFGDAATSGGYTQELQARFHTLPGALPAFHGVDGFTEGSDESPAQIAVPGLGDRAALVAAPSIQGNDGKAFVYGRAPLNVELSAVGIPEAGVRWEVESHPSFAGQAIGSLDTGNGKTKIDYLVTQPSVRTVKLFSGNQLVDSIDIVAVGQVHSLGAGGGSLPHPDPLGNGNENAATRADNPVQPVSIPPFDDRNGNGVQDAGEPTSESQAVEFLMLQHMYTASADIDLAPYTDGRASFDSPSSYGALFNADGLSALDPPFSRQESNNAQSDSANSGFAGEDHNYTLVAGTWISAINNRDQGAARGYTTPDGIYHSPERPVAAAQDDGVDYQFFRMACRIGSTVVAAMPAIGSVAPAERVSLAPLDLEPSGDPVARNISYRFDLNPFVR